MSETSETMIKKPIEVIVEDARGRVITLRKPSVLSTYRFIEALGKSADSETFCNMVMPLQYVIGIDEDLSVPLNTRRELDALIQRLDHDGIDAVMKGVAENFAPASPAEQKGELKK